MLPQPVLVVGTYNADGIPNAMNAAWAGQWDMKQIMISMGSHATTENLVRNGDFTVSFATRDTLTAADYVGLVSAKNRPDKIARTGWTYVKASTVDAPRFEGFPMTLECRICKRLDESPTGFYLIADILNIAVDERYIGPDGKPDVAKMGLITFDPVNNAYIALGEKAGDAFAAGKALE